MSAAYPLPEISDSSFGLHQGENFQASFFGPRGDAAVFDLLRVPFTIDGRATSTREDDEGADSADSAASDDEYLPVALHSRKRSGMLFQPLPVAKSSKMVRKSQSANASTTRRRGGGVRVPNAFIRYKKDFISLYPDVWELERNAKQRLRIIARMWDWESDVVRKGYEDEYHEEMTVQGLRVAESNAEKRRTRTRNVTEKRRAFRAAQGSALWPRSETIIRLVRRDVRGQQLIDAVREWESSSSGSARAWLSEDQPIQPAAAASDAISEDHSATFASTESRPAQTMEASYSICYPVYDEDEVASSVPNPEKETFAMHDPLATSVAAFPELLLPAVNLLDRAKQPHDSRIRPVPDVPVDVPAPSFFDPDIHAAPEALLPPNFHFQLHLENAPAFDFPFYFCDVGLDPTPIVGYAEQPVLSQAQYDGYLAATRYQTLGSGPFDYPFY